MESDSSKGKKRKPAKDTRIKFKVTKDDCLKLKLVKPNDECAVAVKYPDICIKKEHRSNFDAMRKMYTLNHHNILSMKALGPKVTPDTYLVFIEQCRANLNKLIWREYFDNNGHVPSERLQTFVRGIIEGVDFLRENNLYHGNLSWKTTMHEAPFVAKLCNFKTKDGMTIEEAQWEDWNCIRIMLQELSDHGAGLSIFCGEINALIDLISSSNRSMLPRMKEVVLAEVFFWTEKERANFIITTVSELIHNDGFKNEINKSSIVELPWNSYEKNRWEGGPLHTLFTEILEHCNKYRRFKFDYETQSDCLELVCAAYTHEGEMKSAKGFVDLVFKTKYPKIYVELKRIVKVARSATSSQPYQCNQFAR